MSDNKITLLHPHIHKWMYKKGFKELRHIQKEAIVPILEQKKDVIISASTASGKTEAAFFPIFTYIANNKKKGLRVLCISPLRALINDQATRLNDLALDFNFNVVPWHADISQSLKNKFICNKCEIIIITPESLESLLMHFEPWFREAILNIDYVVIDEYHSFIGQSRGIQLQSQLYRIENILKRKIVRIAISATFSNLSNVANELRENQSLDNFAFITPDNTSIKTRFDVQVRGYTNEGKITDKNDSGLMTAYSQVSTDIFRLLRGSSNLVFTNTKAVSESLSSFLQQLSNKYHVPNEFFPHHSSLSKDTREALEKRLQDGKLPTTAICTATLELGIDISDVNTVFQIDEPLSVSALRQRIGRSGRRNNNPSLRIFVIEDISEIYQKGSSLKNLCEKTISSMAVISLLLQKWYEPPEVKSYHLSTLIQQILSVIISNNGASASLLYNILCQNGAFKQVDKELFAKILRSLALNKLIMQMNTGELILDLEAEKLTENFDFLSVFKKEPEYSIDFKGTQLGRIPFTNNRLKEGSTFVFSGKSWVVIFINHKTKTIGVKQFNGIAENISFGGEKGVLHTALRQEMFKIYTTEKYLPCANKTAVENIKRGIETFKELGLNNRSFIEVSNCIALFPWLGDKELLTIKLMLARKHISSTIVQSHIEIESKSLENLKAAVASILCEKNLKPIDLVNDRLCDICFEKFDKYLTVELQILNYANTMLRVDAALNFFKKLAKEL